MFKAHILVNELTDAVGEMTSLEQSARKQNLDESQITVMITAVSCVLVELQRTRSEMIASSISMDTKKNVKSDAYDVTLEMRTKPRSGKQKKSDPLSWILGR